MYRTTVTKRTAAVLLRPKRTAWLQRQLEKNSASSFWTHPTHKELQQLFFIHKQLTGLFSKKTCGRGRRQLCFQEDDAHEIL